jgi:hypothetical protein
MKQNSEAEIKVESTLTSKIITFITCIVWILFISWAYIDAEVVNYKITIMYIVGVLIVIWFLLKSLLAYVYVKDNDIAYQSKLVPCRYIHTNFSNVSRVKISTKSAYLTGDSAVGIDTVYDVMTFYGKHGKLFSINMSAANSNKLYQKAKSHYGIKIEDRRKVKK